MKNISFFTCLLLLLVCSFLPLFGQQKLFELLSEKETGVTFNNRIDNLPEYGAYLLKSPNFVTGGGVAIGDINNDGLNDIVLSGNRVQTRLYLNKGDMKFENITVHAGIRTLPGWSTGCVMADVNGDGWLDIYVCRSIVVNSMDKSVQENLLFINNKDLTFTERGKEYGVNDAGYSIGASFFDYDKDGDLDLIVINQPDMLENTLIKSANPDGNKGIGADKFYRNEKGKFVEVSKEVGLIADEGSGLSVTVADINNDSWLDMYIANDFAVQDFLYINNQDGTFSEKSFEYFKHMSSTAMGTDINDFNNDGLPDIVVVDMLHETNRKLSVNFGPPPISYYENNLEQKHPENYVFQYVKNSLFLNQPGGYFSNISFLSGVAATDWSWGVFFVDFDNDGWKDLFIANGLPKDLFNFDLYEIYANSRGKYSMNDVVRLASSYDAPNYIFQNNHDLTFSNKISDWGFDQLFNTYGAAYGDLDNDGDIDLVLNNVDTVASIYRNLSRQINHHHFLRLKFEGLAKNGFGLGTKATIFFEGKQQFQFLTNSRGYESSSEYLLHFGLGKATKIDSVVIDWLDNKQQVLKNVAVDQILTIRYQDALAEKPKQSLKEKSPLFEEITDKFGIAYRHQENNYVDFIHERLLPRKLSTTGPAIAIGDINNDGIEDVYLGGALGKPGELYIQSLTGNFRASGNASVWLEDAAAEDAGALFFDVDNDGDLDLYVVSGGNENTNAMYLQDRLYINDGKGVFIKALNALPKINASGSVVIASDYDKDGDMDLFIGGRVIGGEYPQPPRSYLLKNQGGHFHDVTDTDASELSTAGLITSALWTDFDNDQDLDLLVVGEWMPISIWVNTNGKFKKLNQPDFEKYRGFWNSVVGGDIDNDGDIDYVLGNMGLNNRFSASFDEPLSIVSYDFDRNGTKDPVMFYFNESVNRPVHRRDVLCDQIPELRNRFISHSSYILANKENLYKGKDLSQALELSVNWLASSVMINLGQGQFEIQQLPMEAQFSPVCGMQLQDFDLDGVLDLALVGNDFGTFYEYGKHDGLNGLYLIGKGNGTFEPLTAVESGFYVPGNAKALVLLPIGKSQEPALLVSNNDAELQAFRWQMPGSVCKSIPFNAVSGEIRHGNKTRKMEVYWGSGYLSQNCRYLWLSEKDMDVVFMDINQNKITDTVSKNQK